MTKNYYGKLLSNPQHNFKAKKNLKLNVHTYYLSLSHSDLSGYNVCPMANKLSTKENNKGKSNCSSVCVASNGNGRFQTVINSRLNKTKRFFEDRENFLDDLIGDITKAILYSEYYGFIPTFRLNAYSDIKWENIKIKSMDNKNIFELFPDIQFYDYTKIPNRVTPNNYSLTYSHYGKMDITKNQIDKGYNVAMVFDSQKNDDLPKSYNGLSIVDGDKTDLRTGENDGVGVIVGLRAKMSKANIKNELNKKMSFIVSGK
jgi:hypothetical protein|tara:strand:- start:600 stop:1376 length:777 start_codon:yes stop_codon:yes gene_type:complete